MERERKPSPTGALHLNVLVYPEESSSHRQHMTLKPGEDWKVCKSVCSGMGAGSTDLMILGKELE